MRGSYRTVRLVEIRNLFLGRRLCGIRDRCRVGMHNSGCIDALGYRVDNAAINPNKEESHV
jgi:hypothetical protein